MTFNLNQTSGLGIWSVFLTALAIIIYSTDISSADEDGVSFWIPGFFGSLAATPQQPGWSLTSILYNTNVSASGNAAVAREITIGDLHKATINVTGNANVHANATIGFLAPSYVFATPFLGGQAGHGAIDGGVGYTYMAMATTATMRHLVGMALDRPTGFWAIPSHTTAIGLGAAGGGKHN